MPNGVPKVEQRLPASRPVASQAVRGASNENPSDISFFALLWEDFSTHDSMVFEQGFWAVAVHRFGNWRMSAPALVRPALTILYWILFRFVEIMAGISLPYTCKLGRRVRIWHHSGIILSAYAIGDDVHIRQNTTMGVARRNENLDIPTIGSRVDIGCGACILGNITVGDDSVIGANAVVVRDVAPGTTVVGIPARPITKSANSNATTDAVEG